MMNSRRRFLTNLGLLTAGTMVLPSCATKQAHTGEKNLGLQLYTFREEMASNPIGTLKQIAAIGIKQIETARSGKGHYYGLSPKEMQNVCADLGMTLRSGHIHLDENFSRTMDEALEAEQEYLICSSMPTKGQTIDNYKRTAEAFNKAGEQCNARGLKFGYHNHSYEFDSVDGEVLYNVLLDNTQADLIHMELDLGWVIVAGKNPIDYFNQYEGRFPLWHLKDMNMTKKRSTEFGEGGLDIVKMLKYKEKSGVKFIFIEQEDYANTPLESMVHNMTYLASL